MIVNSEQYKLLRESYNYCDSDCKFSLEQTKTNTINSQYIKTYQGIFPNEIPEIYSRGINIRKFELIVKSVFDDSYQAYTTKVVTDNHIKNLKEIICAIVHWKMASQGGRSQIASSRVRDKWNNQTFNQLMEAYIAKDITLFEISGIRIPTASAILRFIYPEEFGVIDSRVVKITQQYNITDLNLRADGYINDVNTNIEQYNNEYLSFLRQEANDLNKQGVTFNGLNAEGENVSFKFRPCDIEMALFSQKINEIENNTIRIEYVKLNKISIENFTVFKRKYNLDFSNSLNIFIGENSSGKTHILKLIYCVLENINKISYEAFSNTVKDELENIFKPDELNSLINRDSKSAYITISLEKYGNIELKLKDNKILFKNLDSYDELEFDFERNNIFIPAKELLSFYEGFISLYDNRETSFDKIYYNLAKSLGLSALKNIEYYPVEYKLLCKLEKILEGKILLDRGRFYLVSKNGHKTEITLIAEGLRKVGMIAQLLANGSLTKNSILFWDEPETNLNPRLIRKMAEVLMELSRAGMQIFIATHSLFLVKEIEILRKKQDKVKYFGLGFDENKEIRVSQSEDFGSLKDIIILDEELDQADRFQFNYHQPQ